ncbi:MAG: single-stranded DNA-binding protein [Spirochaetia bacterium]|nr:single-stranded DNA-binding protein [Spirochaetia bacterium]
MFFNQMNINQLKGRIINEPELRETKTGKKILAFTLMYFTRQSTDAEGSHNNFIQVEAWQKVAEICGPMLMKGLEVIVNGNILQKRWTDENGKMKSNFIFTAEAISISDEKFSSGQQEYAEDAA